WMSWTGLPPPRPVPPANSQATCPSRPSLSKRLRASSVDAVRDTALTTLFISDLHLEGARPEIGAQFLAFLEQEASRAEALYILGDLFEYWLGDDDPNSHYADMTSAIRSVSDSGVPVFFMHGNRDFLIGERFAAETNVRLLADPH